MNIVKITQDVINLIKTNQIKLAQASNNYVIDMKPLDGLELVKNGFEGFRDISIEDYKQALYSDEFKLLVNIKEHKQVIDDKLIVRTIVNFIHIEKEELLKQWGVNIRKMDKELFKLGLICENEKLLYNKLDSDLNGDIYLEDVNV